MEITPFAFEDRKLRMLKDADDNPWFVAKDVCDILGTDPKDVPAILDPDEHTTVYTIEGRNKISGLRKDARVLSESGFYSLVLRSRKPEAVRFKDWVCGEVLPSIRKRGGYMLARAEEYPEEIMARALKLAEGVIQKREAAIASATVECVK